MIPSCELSIFAVASKEVIQWLYNGSLRFQRALEYKGIANKLSFKFLLSFYALLITEKLSITCKRLVINYSSLSESIVRKYNNTRPLMVNKVKKPLFWIIKILFCGEIETNSVYLSISSFRIINFLIKEFVHFQ